MTDLNLLIEAERRGIIPPGQAALLAEARKRGLVEPKQEETSSPGMKAARTAEFAARGVSDSALETVGALPDLVSAGFRKIGIPAPEPGFYTDALKQGYRTAGRALSAPVNSVVGDFGPSQPTGALEEGAYGAGRGVADAATIILPAAAIGRVAKAGGTVSNVGKAAAAEPVLQGVAGATGGAVSEVTDNDVAGLAASMAVPGGIASARKIAAPIGKTLSAEEQRLVSIAKAEGIPITPAQETGSRPLQAMESTFRQLPFTARPQEEIYDAQRRAFNKAVLEKAGVQADRASPEVMARAFESIGKRFDDLAAQTTVKIDPKMDQDIRKTATEYGRRLPSDVKPVFQSYVDDLNTAIQATNQPGVVGVSIDGRSYQNIVSNIRAAARSNQNRPDLQRALNGLADSLDGAMERSVPKDLAPQWFQTRHEYKNLLTIDKAMSGGTQADRIAGNVPFGALENAVKGQDKRGFARGRGDLNDLSRVGAFLANKIPNSGTPERSRMIELLTGGGIGGGAGIMAGADPFMTGAAIGAGIAGPRVVQAAYNTRPVQAYMRNSLNAWNASPLSVKAAGAQELGDIKQD